LTKANKKNKYLDCKPFIKWAGGKGQLLLELLDRLPDDFNSYYEPFLGGGALFFALQVENSYLSDINPDLLNAYSVVKNHIEELIQDLGQHVYESNYFYKIRDLDRSEQYKKLSEIQLASRFIYLNKTCFNGLHRVNSKGEFNVPFGRYKNPTICNADNLRACSQALQSAEIKLTSFDQIISRAQKNDLVYFDPPYAPVNLTSSFTKYAKEDFGVAKQEQLSEVCQLLDKQGVYFMLSNSKVPLILDLYKDFKIDTVQATRAINSKASKRGVVEEVIVTNY
jgi:DNA adenine methylase